GDVAQVLELLEAMRPRPGEEDFRGPEWFFLERMCHGEQFQFPVEDGGTYCGACSPDGRLLAAAPMRARLLLWSLADRSLVDSVQGHRGNVCFVTFSPDGKVIASGSVLPSGSTNGEVKLWDVTSRKLQTLEGDPHHNTVYAGSFSPDGRTLATASRDKTIKLWDVPSARLKETLKHHLARLQGLQFSPDGSLLASGGADHLIHIWDVRSGHECATFKGHDGGVLCLDFSHERKILDTRSVDTTIRIW